MFHHRQRFLDTGKFKNGGGGGGQEVDIGDLGRQTADRTNENATELNDVVYKSWNGLLHAMEIEAGLNETTSPSIQSDPARRTVSDVPVRFFDAQIETEFGRRTWSEAGLNETNLDVLKMVTIVSYLLTFVVGLTGNTMDRSYRKHSGAVRGRAVFGRASPVGRQLLHLELGSGRRAVRAGAAALLLGYVQVSD